MNGVCDPRFARVADILDSLDTEDGVAVAVYVQGELVVDLCRGDGWTTDTLANIFSCTKGAIALTAQMLWDRGVLDVDAPVAKYWPEFQATDVLVRHVLSHTAGFPHVPGYRHVFGDDPRTLLDQKRIAAAMAAGEPLWVPGTRLFYHALTIGWLMDEIVSRVDGRTVAGFISGEVTSDIDFWIGLPAHLHHRVAPVLPQTQPAAALPSLDDVETRALMADDGPSPVMRFFELISEPWMRSGELSAGGGIASASGLASLYARGAKLVSEDSMALFTRPHVTQTMLGRELTYGLGWQVPSELPGTFGHDGAGGSLGFHHAATGVSFGFVHDRMHPDWANALRLASAVLEAATN